MYGLLECLAHAPLEEAFTGSLIIDSFEPFLMLNKAPMLAIRHVVLFSSLTEKLPQFGDGGVGCAEDVGITECADDGMIVIL